jgi:heme exporter protein C
MSRTGLHVVSQVMLGVAAAAMLTGLILIFFVAPEEKTMGLVQKIFYYHVPSAWSALVAFILVGIASVRYLIAQREDWDRIASSWAEVGWVFATLVLVTGPLWAKPVWGIWYAWDARGTLLMVLWLLFSAYVMLRRFVTEPGRRGNLCAVVGVLGMLNVPMVYLANRLFRTQHPQPVIAGGEKSGLEPAMLVTLLVSVSAFMIVSIYLFQVKLFTEKVGSTIEELASHIEEEVSM